MLDRGVQFEDNLFLVFFLMLFVACFCYFCVRKPLHEQLDIIQSQKDAIEDELKIQCHMAQQKENMENQMKQEPKKGKGCLGAYHNMTNEINELNQILSETQSYDLNVFPEEVSEDIVRREISISYQTNSYEQAWDILEAIEEGKYCCLIKDMELARGVGIGGETQKDDSVYGRVLVTYFEVSDVEKDHTDSIENLPDH
mgnify:CR=1 FL=1